MDGHEHYKNSNLLTKKIFVCQYIFVWKVFPSVGFMTSSENVHGSEAQRARGNTKTGARVILRRLNLASG